MATPLGTVRAADPGARGRSSVLAETLVDPEAFETLRVELVEGLASTVNRVIQHDKAEVPFAIDQIAQIRATLAGVANIADFVDDFDAAERGYRCICRYEHGIALAALLVPWRRG